MKKAVLLLLLGLLALSASARSRMASIDPSVDSVVSGGYWTDGEDRGIYRVVVRSGGFEHIVSEITIEWLSDPREGNEEPSIHKSVVVKEGRGLWRVADSKLEVAPGGGGVFLDWKAISPHDLSERRCRARLFPDGSYSLVKACD